LPEFCIFYIGYVWKLRRQELGVTNLKIAYDKNCLQFICHLSSGRYSKAPKV
jgi:hypothetical protein